MDCLLAPIAAWIVAVIPATDHAGAAGLMAVGSACVPLPSEVVTLSAGYLASTGRFNLAFAATADAIGRSRGSAAACATGARRVLLAPGDLDPAERFFRRLGGIAVPTARLLPVVRTSVALPVGVARMPRIPFQLCAFAGSWPCRYALACIGCLLRARWEAAPPLRAAMDRLDFAVVGVLALGFPWFVPRHLQDRRRPGWKGGT